MQFPTESAPLRWTTEASGDIWVYRSVSRFIRAWQHSLLRAGWTRIALLLVICGLCAIRAYVGLIGTRDYSHDAFMTFDGAWRMINGQRPHIDFYSHLGFLSYAPTVAGLWLAHMTAWGFGYAQALVGLLLGFWSYLLGRKRLMDVPFALMCLAIVLMSIAPFALGFSPMKITPGMVYNRQGYALIALLILEAFQEEVEPSNRSDWWGGLSSGAITAILLFLKITYFAAALFLLVALIPCRGQSKQRWLGIAAGFVLITIPCCAYFGFHLGPTVRDLMTVGGGKHIKVGWYVIDGVVQDAGVAVVLAAAAALLLLLNNERRSGFSVALAGMMIAFAGTVLIAGNYEQNGFPLAAFLAILILNRVNLRMRQKQNNFDFFHASVLLLGSVLIFVSLFSGAVGMGAALGERVFATRSLVHFKSPVLSGFATSWEDDWYAAMVNNGFPLVEKYRRPNDTIMSLDFTNPYSYGLKMRPAYGGTTVFQYGTTFNNVHKPAPAFLMGSADLVIVPKKASDPTLDDNVPRLYGPYLKTHFHLIGESSDWRLYRRDGE